MQEIFYSFGIIIAAGAVFRRFRVGGIDADSLRDSINVMVLNIFLPALCIKTLYSSVIGKEAVLIPATAWITTLSSLLLANGVYRFFAVKRKIDASSAGVLVLSAAFGNVTYLGLPVLTGIYGQDAAKYALFYDLLATTPCLWIFGASLAAKYGGKEKIGLKESLRIVALLPPVWGIAGGMILNLTGIALPGFILKTLELFGNLVVPLMIFSVGLALTLPKVDRAVFAAPAIAIKLAVVPFISFASARLLGLKGQALSSCLIEGAMPTMVLSLLIASRFKLDITLSAFMIVSTTVLSFLTLPVAAYVAERIIQ